MRDFEKFFWDTNMATSNCYIVLLLLSLLAVSTSKHQLRHKAKMANNRPNPTKTFTSQPLQLLKIESETETPKPENSSSHLRSALDVLAPEADTKSSQEYHLPLLSKPVPEKLHSEAARSSSGLPNTNISRNDVIFEVIDLDPYGATKSRFNSRFFILTGIYVASGLVSIIATYCLAKLVISRRKRHSQYMLLTKSELDYHHGGGGI